MSIKDEDRLREQEEAMAADVDRWSEAQAALTEGEQWYPLEDADPLPALLEVEDDAELQRKGVALGIAIEQSFRDYQNNDARTQQSHARVLGMSELGGCREYIRASIAGDPKKELDTVKWAALVGTWVGDGAEHALTATMPGTKTQTRLTVTLPSGITVSGSTDATLGDDTLIDFKTKDGLDDTIAEGPSFKNLVQISGYLIAAIDDGQLKPGATGHLVYIDRSGRQPHPYVHSISEATARRYLASADERLATVARDLASGRHSPRDEPESYCFHIGCPFFDSCWDGYQPQDEIVNPREILAVDNYVKGRDLKKEGEQYQRAAKDVLNPGGDDRLVQGLTPRHSLKFTIKARPDGTFSTAIDVRARRDKKAVTE